MSLPLPLKRAASHALRLAAESAPSCRGLLARWGLRSDRSTYAGEVVTAWDESRPIRLTGLDRNHLSFLLYWRGAARYEPETTALALDLMEGTDAFLDVGANVGAFTLLAARRHPTLAIHAFEPNPRVRSILDRNIALNEFGNVTVTPLGVCDHVATERLFIPESDMSASLAPEWREAGEEAEIETTTLDAYTARHGIRHCVLKIDVEGVEEAALRGARRLLETDQPDIILEVVHKYSDALQDWLRSIGYRFHHLTPFGYPERKRLVSPYATHDHWKFHNYLLTTRPRTSVEALYERHREMLQAIDLDATYAGES